MSRLPLRLDCSNDLQERTLLIAINRHDKDIKNVMKLNLVQVVRLRNYLDGFLEKLADNENEKKK